MLTDTHAHLYLPVFDQDRAEMMERAFRAGVQRIFLPNIDTATIEPMQALCREYPDNCFAMLGLHPCSVTAGFADDLRKIEAAIEQQPCVAIGEIGIDLYWDKSLQKQQESAFRTQIHWAIDRDIPIVIHSRESFDEVCQVLEEEKHPRLRGIFHCFTGSYEEAVRAVELGFYLGIGGVATFKNSDLPQVLPRIGLEHILLETDAPYLAPVPHRGKRNESSYIEQVAAKLAEIYGVTADEIATQTTNNSRSIFGV